MAIFRGSGGSVEGVTESNTVTIAITQGGTGARTAADARTNLGLGTAATTAASAYATAAQGALADSAVQPSDLGEVATTNLYSDLDGKPTLGTAAVEDVGYFATAAQGALADSATQPGDLATVATTGAYSDLTGKPTVPTNLDSLTDVVITSASTDQLLKYNGTNWVNATVGGSGTVTSVDMSVPTGLTVSGNPVTSTGTLAVTYSAGYAIPTTAKQTEWDTAYTDRNKWDGGATGLTAATGRTSLGLGTAATTAATDYATAAQGTKADTAYGWGNHAVAGYILSGGALGTPSSGTLTNCTFPTLNQNTTGTAGGLTGTPDITVGTLQFNSGYGSSATAYGCRAWVNFNGTGTVAIRGDGNVDTISDNGTGAYTVNFTSAMPDVNYATVLGAQRSGGATGYCTVAQGGTYTTSAVQVKTFTSGAAADDFSMVSVAIFR